MVSRQPPEVEDSIRLEQVRVAVQEGFDRVVFDFAGEVLPGYRIEFVKPPLHKCGSGAPTQVAGAALLQINLLRAQAHTEKGEATAEPRERSLAHPVVRELELTCDFEGEVIWVLGLDRPVRYRVLELGAPTRLVVDVAH